MSKYKIGDEVEVKRLDGLAIGQVVTVVGHYQSMSGKLDGGCRAGWRRTGSLHLPSVARQAGAAEAEGVVDQSVSRYGGRGILVRLERGG